MSESLEDRISSFVQTECSVEKERLSPDTRLSYDLGVEGDHAAEFFDHFGKKFNVDISDLNQNWSGYFSAEGTSPLVQFLWCLPGIAAGIWIAAVLPHLPTWLAWIVGFSAWLAISFGLVRWWQRPRANEITLGDLAEWASHGRASLGPRPKTELSPTEGRI